MGKEFTAKELEEKVQTLIDEEAKGFEEGWYSFAELEGWGENPNKTIELEGFGTIEFVEDFGGEGMGDQRWTVFKIGERFFRTNGYYDSWNGAEWHGDIEEVVPKEVVRVEYEAKG